ncbi:hypothetical protein Acr_00g0053330 [Actinidia rufa]|uniref:Uncharacterized protein n=2 Tax=asterids TaxID=71274 RepID=A0A7J0DNA6_9ERIC|nr:hypothetical protein Acr_00g0053330 [Actinidia rufa]
MEGKSKIDTYGGPPTDMGCWHLARARRRTSYSTTIVRSSAGAIFRKQLSDDQFKQKGSVYDKFGKPILTTDDSSNPCWVPLEGVVKKANGKLGKTEIFPTSTDARYYRDKGLPAIGFSPITNTPILLHDHHEFLRKDEYLKRVDTYESIIKAYASDLEHTKVDLIVLSLYYLEAKSQVAYAKASIGIIQDLTILETEQLLNASQLKTVFGQTNDDGTPRYDNLLPHSSKSRVGFFQTATLAIHVMACSGPATLDEKRVNSFHYERWIGMAILIHCIARFGGGGGCNKKVCVRNWVMMQRIHLGQSWTSLWRKLKEALDADIQDRIMKEREMQSYIEEREREVAEREAAWKAELSRREAEIARQEARLKMERENLEKEKSVLMGTASNQDNQDGALEITVSGEKYRCLRFAKAKK